MKKNLQYVLVFIIFSFSIQSCVNKKSENAILELDSLLVKLDTAQKNIAIVDSIKLNNYMVSVDSSVFFFQQNIQDTILKEQAIVISKYISLQKPFNNMHQAYYFLLKEIPTSRRQIENLKHDLQERLFDNEKIEKFVLNEKQVVENIYSVSRELMKVFSEKGMQFEELDSVIKAMVDSIKIQKSRIIQ